MGLGDYRPYKGIICGEIETDVIVSEAESICNSVSANIVIVYLCVEYSQSSWWMRCLHLVELITKMCKRRS